MQRLKASGPLSVPQDKAKVLADVRGIIATQLGTDQEKVSLSSY